MTKPPLWLVLTLLSLAAGGINLLQNLIFGDRSSQNKLSSRERVRVYLSCALASCFGCARALLTFDLAQLGFQAVWLYRHLRHARLASLSHRRRPTVDLILGRWITEEGDEIMAATTEREVLDGVLDALGLCLMRLHHTSPEQLWAALSEYEAAQRRRNRPILAHSITIRRIVQLCHSTLIHQEVAYYEAAMVKKKQQRRWFNEETRDERN